MEATIIEVSIEPIEITGNIEIARGIGRAIVTATATESGTGMVVAAGAITTKEDETVRRVRVDQDIDHPMS